MTTFQDVGVGPGIELSGGISFGLLNVLGRPDQITPQLFGGLRSEFNFDVGNGILGGVTFGVSHPGQGQPIVLNKGLTLGVGATSPFGVGGNYNFGYTIIHPNSLDLTNLRLKKNN